MSSSHRPASSGLSELATALRPHAPFSAMAEGDLERVVQASRVERFAAGDTILAPGVHRPEHCYVIRQGGVRGERQGTAGPEGGLWELSAGEMFPLGALLGATRRDVGLPRGTGHVLPRVHRCRVRRAHREIPAVSRFLHASPRLSARFAARYVQAEYVGSITARHDMTTPLNRMVRGSPVTAAPDMALEEALTTMEARGIGSLPVVDVTGGRSASSRGRT